MTTRIYVQQLVQAIKKEIIKVPHYRPFVWGNPPVIDKFTSRKVSNVRDISISWHYHWCACVSTPHGLAFGSAVRESPSSHADGMSWLFPWWRHQMETFFAFPAQRPVTRSFDVSFDLCLNKRFSKQSWGWWFETPSCSFWRHRNVQTMPLTPVDKIQHNQLFIQSIDLQMHSIPAI